MVLLPSIILPWLESEFVFTTSALTPVASVATIERFPYGDVVPIPTLPVLSTTRCVVVAVAVEELMAKRVEANGSVLLA